MKKIFFIGTLCFLFNQFTYGGMSDINTLINEVALNVDFEQYKSFSYSPPLEIELKNKEDILKVTFADTFCSKRPEEVFIIANIRNSDENIRSHSAEDYEQVNKIINHQKSSQDLKISNIKEKDKIGKIAYCKDFLMFLGHWSIFLSFDPFPRETSKEDMIALLLKQALFNNKLIQ